MDQLPEHDRLVEEELFARLAAEMGPITDLPDERSRLRTALSATLVVLGLVAVVLGLSSSLVISAAGYTAALFGLITVAPALQPGARRLGSRIAGLRHTPH